MKIILFPILLLCLVYSGSAQQIQTKRYSEGPLSLNDFKGEILELDSMAGQAYFDFITVNDEKEIDGVKLETTFIEAIIITDQSWLNMDIFSGSELAYFQVLFDIEQLYAQQYNQLVVSRSSNYQNDFNLIVSDKNINREKFILESKNGKNKRIIEKWQAKMDKKLQESQLKIELPNLNRRSHSGLSGSFGASKLFNTDEYEFHFGSPFALKMSLEFKLRNHLLLFQAHLTSSDMDNEFNDYPYWDKDINLSQVVAHFAYGYAVNISDDFRLVGLVGPSLNNVYVAKDEFEDIYPSVSDTQWTFGGGLFIEYVLNKSYRAGNVFSPFASGFHYSEIGMRLGVDYISNTSTYDTYSGNTSVVYLSFFSFIGT